MELFLVRDNKVKENVAELMKVYGVRQLDIAVAVGVSQAQFSAMLNGYLAIPDHVLLGVQRLKQAAVNRAKEPTRERSPQAQARATLDALGDR